MVDAHVLRRRIDALLESLARLECFRDIDRSVFIANGDTHQLAAGYRHLAVEAAIDIARHVVAHHGHPAPGTYRDAFAVLGREGFLFPELALP